MAAHICSSSPPSDLGGGAAFACQWQASRRGDWYEGEGEGGVDDETGHHRWAQPAQPSAVAEACPLPCKGALTERGGRDTAPWANTHTQPHTCDETAHSDSGALYIPPKNYLGINTVTSTPTAFGYATGTVVGGSFDNTIPASGVDSAPAPFSLARELAPARPARPRPKGVTIGQFSVVRVCVCGEAEGFVSSDSTDEEKDGIAVSLNRRDDICSPTLTEDGPREESLLLDRMIVTHFEGWALTNAGAIADFLGGERLLLRIGPPIVARLQEMVRSLEGGEVEHVGTLPSCVRMGAPHLPHLRTLLHWTMASVRYVENKVGSESDELGGSSSSEELGERSSDEFRERSSDEYSDMLYEA